MRAERLKQVETIYHAALKIQLADREAFLTERCGGDVDLRREVESLLSFSDSSDNFLDASPQSFVAGMFLEKEEQNNLAGREIGHYKIIKLLGKGGMGEVYLAEDRNLNRQVALKFLPAELTGNTDRLKRFEREAQTASGLNHTNILTVHQFGAENNRRFIVTEFVSGVTLREKMAGGRPALSEMLDIAVQTAAALAVAHEAKIIHRDIKPDNVMIRADGLVKVLDFGLAKLVERSGENDSTLALSPPLTNPGVVMGTADYMSPEQARGLAVDARTDIFSFGVMLYEMLTGEKPFTGDTVNHTIVNILEKEIPPVFALAEDCPAELEQIIRKALAKKPDERFRTAAELVSGLKKLQRHLEFGTELRETSPPKSPDDEKTRVFETGDGEIPVLPPNNLNDNHSPIIGREKEIAQIKDLLNRENVRFLTMTGIGGTGKTRLAQTVAKRILGDFPGGVFFVALASITDFKLVVSTIAQTLGVEESGGEPILNVLKSYLRDKQILLILDNFEQVADAGKEIAELLESGNKLKILITSRELLRLNAEKEFIVLPLIVPPEGMPVSFTELSDYEAIRFFVERARFAQTDFSLTKKNADSVAEICRRLDGLPLAIQLAAARVKLFAPAAILTRLSNSLKLLTGGAKDLPERQQTMRGAIAWSYDLLDADEKKLFNRLAVFVGGFTLDGAEKLAVEENTAKETTQNISSEIDIYDGISSLLDKSLIVRRDQVDGEPRFRMLAVVREFALEKLAGSGEAYEIKRLHAEFYADLSKEAEPELMGAKTAEWMEKLESEHDNFRAALGWTLEAAPEISLQIVAVIYRFWLRRGFQTEGRKWIKQALEKKYAESDRIWRAKASRGGGLLSLQQGDFEAANLYIGESLDLSREIGDRQLICYALNSLGAIRVGEGDFSAAQTLTEECLAIAAEINDRIQTSIALNRLGDMSRQKDDYEAARKFYAEAYDIAKQESINAAIPIFAHNLASVACLLEDYRTARLYAFENLKSSEELGHKTSIGGALDVFAALAVKTGETKKAARLYGAARSIYDAADYKLEKADLDFNDRYLNEARAAIGDEAFDAASAAGRAMAVKEAIALAREDESARQTEDPALQTSGEENTFVTNFQAAAETGDKYRAETFVAVHSGSEDSHNLKNIETEKSFIQTFFWLLLAIGTLIVGFGIFKYFSGA